MNSAQRFTVAAIAVALAGVVGLVMALGVVPALFAVWAISLVVIVAILRYEEERHPVPLPSVETVADVVVVAEPVISLTDAAARGGREKLTHRRRRRRSHDTLHTPV